MTPKLEFAELVLTCGSWQEAQNIADKLLSTRLVACVELMAVKSKYHWKRQLEEAQEVKLIMTSLASNFSKIETEVKKLHSYEIFVLQMIPVIRVSKDARAWLTKETNGKA